MNPEAVLALVADLYAGSSRMQAQLAAALEENGRLRQENADLRAQLKDDAPPPGDGTAQRDASTAGTEGEA